MMNITNSCCAVLFMNCALLCNALKWCMEERNQIAGNDPPGDDFFRPHAQSGQAVFFCCMSIERNDLKWELCP